MCAAERLMAALEPDAIQAAAARSLGSKKRRATLTETVKSFRDRERDRERVCGEKKRMRDRSKKRREFYREKVKQRHEKLIKRCVCEIPGYVWLDDMAAGAASEGTPPPARGNATQRCGVHVHVARCSLSEG